MRWESVNSSNGQREYDLWHNNKKVLTLTFHRTTNSARVESARERRVFLIRNEGFLRTKTVMRTEYGIRIGYLRFENNFIEMNDKRFIYTIENEPLSQVTIYKESDKDKPFVVCGLNIDSAHLENNKKLPSGLEAGLLLALCWYMVLPPVKETKAEFAL